jgi:hypothetical protein
MKQGKTEKAVFAKLSTQKVELSNELSIMLNVISAQLGIDERVRKESQELLFTLERDVPKGNERYKTNLSVIKASKGKIDIVEEELGRVERMAKELGVKPSEVRNYNKVSSELDVLKKSLEDIEMNLTKRLGRILN